MKSRISIVIPVYNEADRIHDCLQAVAEQTTQPFEVIVVDNNSTDGTAVLAAQFPFVRVLQERRQGVVYARDRGFNAARGDVIARIDADTLVAPDWVETLRDLFAAPGVDLVTGTVAVREMGAAGMASRIDLFWRRYLYNRLGTELGLQGANMALRRSVWQAIKNDVCHQKGLHEDFDIGLHANAHGFTAILYEAMQVSVCHRQLDANLRDFTDYALTSPRTYLAHGRRKSARVMYPVVAFVLAFYPIIMMLSRGYDEDLGRFSWLKLLADTAPVRVNPANYVD